MPRTREEQVEERIERARREGWRLARQACVARAWDAGDVPDCTARDVAAAVESVPEDAPGT